MVTNHQSKKVWLAFLARLDERTNLAHHAGDYYAQRALFHMLSEEIEHLGRFPRTPDERLCFHKMFRQADVTSSGHKDMVIWCLLNGTNVFFDLAAEFSRKKRQLREHKRDRIDRSHP